MGRLSDARIRSLKPAPQDRWIGDGSGLWLRVRRSGSKVFVIRAKRGGRTKVLTLGEWPGITLQAARLGAFKVHADRSGHLLRADNGGVTVQVLAEEFFERRISGRYRRTKNAKTYLERLTAELGWRKVREVRPQDISAIAKAYAAKAPVAANRFLSFTKLVFAYAVQTGILDLSPADKLTAAAAGGAETSRDRELSDDELRRLWNAGSDHQRLLRFLLLTGARIGEAQKATWENISLRDRRWSIPIAHAKDKRPHWVHLSEAAIGILGPAGEARALALRSSSETAVQAWLRRWCERERIEPKFTPHDLRRSFVTRMGTLGVAPHIIRKCINHVEQSALAVYMRSEFEPERIEATERWNAELLRIVGDQ